VPAVILKNLLKKNKKFECFLVFPVLILNLETKKHSRQVESFFFSKWEKKEEGENNPHEEEKNKRLTMQTCTVTQMDIGYKKKKIKI
jgi:hypothetical protein